MGQPVTTEWKTYSAERTWTKAPEFKDDLRDDPDRYQPSEELATALDVAVSLGLPLLVTGEPGTGKTQLAYHAARRFGQEQPIVFQAKTTSSAQDLFYRYDALSHFHESTFDKSIKPDAMRHVEFQGLGLAILLALDPEYANPLLPKEWKGMGPRRSVVLIDEIDKAPRDLPNDILREIETMSFTVREANFKVPGEKVKVDKGYRPIVILTSNQENHLPPAFLRRCAYFHIEFPSDEKLISIIDKRVPLDAERFDRTKVERGLAVFRRIRDAGLSKRPATAELLSWLQMLNRTGTDIGLVEAGNEDAVNRTAALLAKTTEDRKLLRGLFVKQ